MCKGDDGCMYECMYLGNDRNSALVSLVPENHLPGTNDQC